jgi:hypothetical protein
MGNITDKDSRDNNMEVEGMANMDSNKAGINKAIMDRALTILKGIIQVDIFQDRESRNLDTSIK